MKVTEDSYRAYMDFCAKHGISLSAYLEAVGHWLTAHPDDPAGGAVDAVVSDARRIDAQRRSRART